MEDFVVIEWIWGWRCSWFGYYIIFIVCVFFLLLLVLFFLVFFLVLVLSFWNKVILLRVGEFVIGLVKMILVDSL